MAISKIETNSLGSTSVIHSDTTLALQTNGTTTAVTIDASQNVGIGTASPAVALDISSTANSTSGQLRIASAGSNGTRMGFISTSTNGKTYQIGSNFITGTGEFGIYDATAAATRMLIDSSGNLLVGTTSASANSRVRFVTSSSSTADWGFLINNASGQQLLGIDNGGNFYTGNATYSPYNATTASAANVNINSSGGLLRSTSSIKYKTDVADMQYGLKESLKLRPVTYKGKNDGDKVFAGLIAEEVDEIGMPEFVQYAEDGSPDALAYGNMVALAFKAIQELNAKVDAQAAEIAALKGAK